LTIHLPLTSYVAEGTRVIRKIPGTSSEKKGKVMETLLGPPRRSGRTADDVQSPEEKI